MKREPPQARPSGVSDSEAITLCKEWMIFLGDTRARECQEVHTDVCDLYGDRFLAWVDNRDGNLEAELVRKAIAVSRLDGRRALLFVSGGCGGEAQALADIESVAILQYEPRNRTISGANRVGRKLLIELQFNY